MELKNEFFASNNEKRIDERVKVFFEDKEAAFVFSSIVTSKHAKKMLKLEDETTCGCDQYITLATKNRVREFSQNSIVCLDGDQQLKSATMKSFPNFIMLPTIGNKPPEAFVFSILSEEHSEYWKCVKNYNYACFMNNDHYQTVRLILQDQYGDLDINTSGPFRTSGGEYYRVSRRIVWKKWFEIEKKNFYGSNNPVKYWAKQPGSQATILEFLSAFIKAFNYCGMNIGITSCMNITADGQLAVDFE